MGMGKAAGENRAIRAIENALASPLLNSNDITGAKSILINISSGSGEHEITMDELGEITDYMYESASVDALIIRGLSKDENLKEEICVTVIATGFESNSIFQPYKSKPVEKVELLTNKNTVPKGFVPETGNVVFSVHDKGKKNIITDMEEESQGVIDFNNENNVVLNEIRNRRTGTNDEPDEKPEARLRMIKQAQNAIKKEGLSNKTMKDNIDTFEDVPAYVRRNLLVDTGITAESKVSKYTMTSDDENEPVISENNVYVNKSVD
jgi:cell division protein FtsZ